MGEVITIKDQSTWRDVTLAKKQLAWHIKEQTNPMKSDHFDFSEAIDKEENIIRSFLDSLRDRAA